MFQNELKLVKLINFYFNLKPDLILMNNSIFNMENYQVKDSMEQLKNVKVNLINNIMQLNLLNKIKEKWI